MTLDNKNLFLIIPITLLAMFLCKNLLVPLCFALFIFIIMKSLALKLSKTKIPIFRENYNISFFIISISLIIIIYFFVMLLENNLSKVIRNSELYQINLMIVFDYIKNSKIGSIPISLNELLSNINFTSIFSKILNSLTNIVGSLSLVLIYLVFLIIEEKFFKVKIIKLFSKESSRNIFKKIGEEIFSYFQLKTFTSLLTGSLTFIVLSIFNSDLAIFFAILAFILNFIPFLGSLFSVILPFLFSLVQFLDLLQSIFLFFTLLIIQIFIGNFIEPKLMGKSLNLSPVIMLITLGLMGNIWGVSGMFLSIPLLVILLITLANFKSTKGFAILLSEKGEIN